VANEHSTEDATPRFEKEGSELFFALVYPVGVNAKAVIQALRSSLANVDYAARDVHLIAGVSDAQHTDLFERYWARMDAGNDFRKKSGREDAFAYQAATKIAEDRASRYPEETPLLEQIDSRTAYIIRSLKRPEEVHKLRDIYGDALVVVAAHSPRKARSDSLTWDIARSGTTTATPNARRADAEKLIARDEREADDDFGQRVSDTFPLADVFVDASHPEKLKQTLDRFIEILFGYPFHTPTRTEYGMFHAQGSALRSSDLSRQVGAAITDHDGQVVALGTNEVPKGGGGPYWEDGTTKDGRDFTFGYDVSTDMKKRALRQLLERLEEQGQLKANTDEVMDLIWPTVSGTELMNVGEFGRGVHAEMAAIVDAARRGVAIASLDLYTTTFPCHVCARHIVEAGIRRVIYNEPYPKSLAEFLHLDSIAIDDPYPTPGRTNFISFQGLAPRLYERMFRMEGKGWRKKEDGSVIVWSKSDATPRLEGVPADYIPKEVEAVEANLQLAVSTSQPNAPPE
jgi:deoxycytidylate deaminase